MSEWTPQVVRIGKVGRHPNATNLSITHVLGNYQVVFRTEDFKEGDLAGYIPVDTLVPNYYDEFTFLFEDTDKEKVRIKARKLRGIFSMGMLVKMENKDKNPQRIIYMGSTVDDDGEEFSRYAALEEGLSIVEEFGLEKYEPEEKLFLGLGPPRAAPATRVEIPTYDVEGLRKYADIIEEGTQVVITEKVHGANARFVYWDGALHVGSRHNWVDPEGASVWATVARRWNLAQVLDEWPGYVFYGEVFGKVQELKYGRDGDIDLVLFDAYSTMHAAGEWGQGWTVPAFTELFCWDSELPHVPILYRGPFDLDLAYELAEGPSEIPDADHVREGIVITPADYQWHPLIGRVILKLAGEGYLMHKRS